jgi:VacB/RNase II family 3'-5' exoribonuclease
MNNKQHRRGGGRGARKSSNTSIKYVSMDNSNNNMMVSAPSNHQQSSIVEHQPSMMPIASHPHMDKGIGIANIQEVIQSLRKLENDLKEKDRELVLFIRECNRQREEIKSNLKILYSQMETYVKMLQEIPSLLKQPDQEPSAQQMRKEGVQIQIEQQQQQFQKEQQQQFQKEQQQLQLLSPQIYPNQPILQEDMIEQTKEEILICLNELRFADAARTALKLRIEELPLPILFSLYKALENPETLPRSAIDHIIDLMANSIKRDKQTQTLNEKLETQRRLVLHYSKRMTIRRYKLLLYILGKIYSTCSLPFSRTLPQLPIQKNITEKIRTFLNVQSYIATMLVANPDQSREILKPLKVFYKKFNEELELVSYALHETSLEALRGNHVKELSPYISESNSDSIKHKIEFQEIKEQDAKNDLNELVEFANEQKEIEEQQARSVFISEEPSNQSSISELTAASLTEESMELFQNLAPTEDEIEHKKELINEIASISQIIFPGSEVHAFGSSASNLGIKGSDIDISIKVQKDIHADNNLQMKYLQIIYKAICSTPELKHLVPADQPIIRSRVPIIQITDTKRNIECDICIGQLLGVANTEMIRLYSEFDPRVRPLIYVVKHWIKARHINNPPSGSLSSYSYVLLVIHFLQTLRPPILPSLQALINHPDIEPSDINSPPYINAYDCRYVTNMNKVHEIWRENEKNTMTVGQLIAGFFNYYATVFNFHLHTASVRLARTIPKQQDNRISIEDPFERRDLGSVVSDVMVPRIIEEFKRAYVILCNGGSIADICEEREVLADEFNIHMRQDYEEHISITDALDLISKGELHKGIIRVNKFKFNESYVTVEGFPKDILIDSFKDRNRALHGDAVAVKINFGNKVQNLITDGTKSTDIEEERLTGTVVCILEKKSPSYFACTMKKDEETRGYKWLLPMDKRQPKIMVPFEDFKSFCNVFASDMEEVLLVGEMLPWKKARHYPKGRIIGILGLKRDLWSQKRAILLQNMPTLFDSIFTKNKKNIEAKAIYVPDMEDAHISNEKLRAENLAAHKETWEISNIEIDVEKEVANGYVDWRKRRVFTIDPPTSRDLDDALSIEHVEGEWYNVTVYVADVTRFIEEGSEVDLKARKRATSVYLIDTVDHMLDPYLSQNLCSLLPGVTRFSVAVEFQMNIKGEIRKDTVNFVRCIICSCCRLDYDSVQDTLEGKPIPEDKRKVLDGFQWKDICDDLAILNQMAQALRSKRRSGGSVELSKEELIFEMDEDGYPIRFSKAVHNESHQLIEEYALLANQLAATTLHDYYKDNCLLRQHSPPGTENWTSTVIQMAYAISKMSQSLKDGNNDTMNSQKQHSMILEITTMLKEGRTTQEVMNKLQSYTEEYPFMQQAVRHALLREMQLAKYVRKGDCDEKDFKAHHFALNMDFYTHFTSPIRRYADILVHRQLLQMIADKRANKIQEDPKPSIHGEKLSKIVEHINEQAYRAKTSQEQCQRLYLAYYLIPKITQNVERVEAVVMSLGKRAFTVFVPKYCVEIKCDVMKQFVPLPQSMKEVQTEQILSIDSNRGKEASEGINVESLVITWSNEQVSNPNDSSSKLRNAALNRSIELKPLKRILVDLDIDFEATPCDIYVYNVWEFDQQLEENSGSTLKIRNRGIVNMPTSHISDTYLKEKQKQEKQDLYRQKKQKKNEEKRKPEKEEKRKLEKEERGLKREERRLKEQKKRYMHQSNDLNERSNNMYQRRKNSDPPPQQQLIETVYKR